MTLEVVNVQKGGVVEVAKWLSSPMKSNESAAEALLSGSLTRFTCVSVHCVAVQCSRGLLGWW
jgi:hypothetical protein